MPVGFSCLFFFWFSGSAVGPFLEYPPMGRRSGSDRYTGWVEVGEDG